MTKARSFRIPDETLKKLEDLSSKENNTLTETLVMLINEGSHGYVLNAQNEYEWLDDPCIALTHLNDGWFCCIKAPYIKKLGDGCAQDAQKICTVCKKIKGILTENQLLKTQLEQGIEVSIPYCRAKGSVSEDQQTIRCPLEHNYPVKITHCKTKLNGSPCQYFKLIKIQSS